MQPKIIKINYKQVLKSYKNMIYQFILSILKTFMLLGFVKDFQIKACVFLLMLSLIKTCLSSSGLLTM